MAVPWVLVAWAIQFRRELIAIAPNRDTASDGSVGDLAHQGSPSGHNPDESGNAERSDADNINEVRAIDVDKDINVPGLTMAMVVAYLVGRCRAGLERRLIYIIYNGVIWSASSGWVAREYTGRNPHDKHAHLSGHPDGDNDARPFGLASLVEEDGMSFTDAQMRAFAWQYNGRGMPGVPEGRSTLWALGTVYSQTREALAKLDALAAAVNGLVAEDLDGDMAALTARFDEERQAWEAQLAELEQAVDEVPAEVAAALGHKPAGEVAAALVAAGQDPAELAAALNALAAA